MTPQEKLKKIREELRQAFLERADLIDGALAALLSSHHVLIVGPPGTAKSMLADEMCRRIEGANYFQWLLTRFTTPEEIFGAVSLKALEQDDYRRVTAHKLPECHIAFLDEIFKANSSILNAILTLINERLFHNGKEVVQVPLLTLFGASNELPEEEELTALYDRFLVRFVVDYIAEDFRFLRMLESQAQTTRTSLTLSELRELQEQVRAIGIPAHVYRSIADIRRELNKKGIQASDRRYRQSLSLLQARAYLEGQLEVLEKDLFFLEHVLWRDPGEHEQVRNTIRELLLGYEEEITELLFESREIRESATRSWETSDERARALIEFHTKLRNILAKVDQVIEKAKRLGRPLDRVGSVRDEIEQIQKEMLEQFWMAPKRGKKSASKRVFQSLPHDSCWLENDAYDRRVYAYLRAESPSLRALEEAGSTFLPHFGSLLQDIFCLLFKYNVIFHKPTDVVASALLNEKFLNGIRHGNQYDFLREQTVLNEARAGLSTLLLGERLLALIKAEKLLTRRDMRDLWDIQKQEEIVGEKLEEYENADTIPDDNLSEEGKKALQKAKERLAGEVQGADALLRHKTAQLKEDLKQTEAQTTNRLQAEAIKVAQELEDATEEAEAWGSTLGTGQRSPPGQKLELGKRLAGNEKLKRLARMVGRMKFHAMALRKKVFERSNEEVLEVERGDSLQRLLPHEMIALHHPILRKDFHRRFLDQELLQYSLRGVEEKGKGPMIVCLDGSSSMAGDKEIWSKAVTLTLLEIARRQRRLFRSICFSSEQTPLQILDLNPREHYEIKTKNVMDLAEYFPGGGTDFQKPLDAALECLQQARFKKGDIVFITDGECQVSSEWAEQFRHQKEKLGFSLFSILIDVGSSSLGTLKEFSDRITTIKQLTGDEAADIFVNF